MSDDQKLSELTRTRAAIRGGIAEGLHTGCQLFASIAGQPVADLAMGDSREATIGQPAVAMTRDTIVLWLSSTKPVVAAVILQLVEAGRLELDRPVADSIPAFAAGGKESITLRHLLTHTGGFRYVDVGWPETGWDEIIARICRAKVERDWVVGQTAGYHPFTSWYILGELVRIAAQQPLPTYVRQHVLEPLGMLDCWIGMPREQWRAYGNRVAKLIDTERPQHAPFRYANEQGATDCIPGGNGVGPLGELVRFYEMLLGGGQRDGVRILSAESVRMMTSRQREGKFDLTFKRVIDWGLGLIIDSKRYGIENVPYGYGRHASDSTFGHGGSQSSVGFADPDRQLAVGCYFNGMPGEAAHQKRLRAVLDALYEDLGLV
jgi:CubicO group peptidase (beta-lactamase class C family)